MGNWNSQIFLKNLMTEKEDWESIQESMNDIANILDMHNAFITFDKSKFRNIPKRDDVITPLDYANKLMDQLYNFADEHRIWID